MSLVTVKEIEGVLTPEQKRQLIKKLTDVMVEFEGEKLRPITRVIIEDAQAMQSGAAAITEAIGATWCA